MSLIVGLQLGTQPQTNRDSAKAVQAQLIKSALQERGWSQTDLAKAAQLPKYTVSRAVNGKHLVEEESLRAIARALDIEEGALVQPEKRASAHALPEGVTIERQTDGRFRLQINTIVEPGVQLIVEALLMHDQRLSIAQLARFLSIIAEKRQGSDVAETSQG